MEKMINILLVERLDGSPAAVSAPYGTGSEGDIVFFGDSEEHVGQIVSRAGTLEDSALIQMLRSFTAIYPAKQVFRHSYTREETDET